MSLFELSTAIEDVVGNLKLCLKRNDTKKLKLKAKSLIVRYDNPLIIAYSDELDDEDLVRMTVTSFKETQDPQIVRLLCDIISILVLRPRNLSIFVKMDILREITNAIITKEKITVNFITQALGIVIVLLDFDEFRKMVEASGLLNYILMNISTYPDEREFISQCLRILFLCCAHDPLVSVIIYNNGCELVTKALEANMDHMGVATNGPSVIQELLRSPKGIDKLLSLSIAGQYEKRVKEKEAMKDFFKSKIDKDKQDQVVKKNIIDVLSELLKIHDKDEAVLLPTTHSFRMIISLRKARDLATKANSAQYLVNVLKRHINGMLAIVQYSFMSLVIMATSIECRDNCRSAHVEGVLTRCLEQYSTNAGVVRNSCICIAALIYNNEYIDCLDERMVKAMNKSIKAIKEGEHTTTLRVITAALKEASLYPQCVKKLIAGGTIDTLIALIKTHSQDKVIVALSIATLVKLSTETSSHDLFLHEDGAVVIPSLLSLYFNKSWIVVRATTLLLRNLVQSDSWKHALAEKDGFKHVIRTIAHYIRNCQSIVFVCLEVIKGILELNPVPTKVRDERVVKVLRVSEQAYYHRSRVISTLSKDCLKVLLTRDPSAADKAGAPEKEKEGK